MDINRRKRGTYHMFCQRCGQKLKDDSNFCPACGSKAGGPVASNELVRWDTEPRPIGQTPQPYANRNTAKYDNYGLASMVCGLLGTLFFWLIVPGFVLGIIAVILGIMARIRLQDKKGKAIAGLVLGIAALALAIWLIAAAFGDSSWYLNDQQMELDYI